ncbi:hypothetical protein CEXT_521921 [Caerostris extrusa]|uniref:Uncharacterized protein n=1 Tax=Caerostris extrusa TaxID=172846 RepID=A0AAV4SLT5_CAEEX|nr:hypothetical protein CEXT_521921 [Caerostris extrusa]
MRVGEEAFTVRKGGGVKDASEEGDERAFSQQHDIVRPAGACNGDSQLPNYKSDGRYLDVSKHLTEAEWQRTGENEHGAKKWIAQQAQRVGGNNYRDHKQLRLFITLNCYTACENSGQRRNGFKELFRNMLEWN